MCVCVCSCRDNRVQGGGDTEKIKRGGRERIIRCVLDASFSSLSRERMDKQNECICVFGGGVGWGVSLEVKEP